MLTRRGFPGVAGCALCGLAEFVATGAAAQGAPAAATPGVTRKILSQTDGPAPGYVTLLVEAEIEAGVEGARLTRSRRYPPAFVSGGGSLSPPRPPTPPPDPRGGLQTLTPPPAPLA